MGSSVVAHGNAPQFEKNITPADSTGILNCTHPGGRFSNMIWVGVSGNVRIWYADEGDDITDNAKITVTLLAGFWHFKKPFKHIYANGTSATNIRVGCSFQR